MGYDPNSVKARKGAYGEKIVKKTLENLGYTVRKPLDTPKSGASTVDFAIYLRDVFKCYAEVKVQAAYPFGVEDALCYSFPVSRIEAYKNYGEKHATEVLLYVVDPVSGMIYSAPLSELEKSCRIDAREFPFDRWVDSMGSDFRYFHQVQFQTRYKIDADELAELQMIDGTAEKEELTKEQPPTDDIRSFADAYSSPRTAYEFKNDPLSLLEMFA